MIRSGKTTLLGFALGLGCLVPHGAARAGQEGHGGDPLAAEFVAKGWQLYTHLEAQNDLAPDLTATDLDRLRVALTATRIEPVTNELVDEYGAAVEARVVRDRLKPVVAGQPPALVIQVHRQGLYDFLRRGTDLSRLVMHEYLWVLGKNDENYRISGRLGPASPDLGLPQALKDDICRE